MGRPPKARRIILLLISASAITLSTCKGVGIFAFIAVSDPIDESRLPKGTSASRVVQIENEFAASKYAYFSSGSSLFRKNMADRASESAVWSTVPLPSGWTNIQSMAASNHRLLLALARESGGILTSGLFYYNTEGFRRVDGTPFTGTRDSYHTLRVFAPNPSGPFYVNVLEHTGAFGRKEARFTGSKMYTLPGNGSARSWSTRGDADPAWTDTLKNRYVSSAASSETAAPSNPRATLFSTVNPDDTAGGGALADSDGVIVDSKIKRAVGGLTWLPNVTAGAGKGAFIMSTLEPSGGTYTVYIGKDNGTWKDGSWAAKGSSFRFESFLDISAARSGGQAPGSLVLAGTRSAGITRGSGYMEIDVNSPDPAKWTIRTGRSGFTFADTTNYESGALVQSSIPGLALFEGYVYASTGGNGVWRINANDYKGPSERPKWAPE